MKSVDLVYFDAGGGHRAAALALQEAIAEQRRPWRVRLVHLTETLDPSGAFRRVLGFEPEAFYNKRLAHGLTLGLAQELKLLQAMIRLGHEAMLRRLRQHWAATEPDLVVSLVPNFNRVLCESVGAALPGVPFVTVMTDMADHPPHFWIEPGGSPHQHLVCGTEHAAAQALAAGCDAARVWRSSGMILRPAFHHAPPIDRDAERRALGLDPQRPTGLVLFGGHGSRQMLRIARALDHVQLILLCGHNQALATRLRRRRPGAGRAAHAVLGFTREVWRVMQMADFFIGKPGPGSLSEAVQMGLPVITFKNRWTLPQERWNTQWVRDQGVGLVLPGVAGLPEATAALLADLPAARRRVRALRNDAVHEVPALLARLLDSADTSAPLPLRWRGDAAPLRR